MTKPHEISSKKVSGAFPLEPRSVLYPTYESFLHLNTIRSSFFYPREFNFIVMNMSDGWKVVFYPISKLDICNGHTVCLRAILLDIAREHNVYPIECVNLTAKPSFTNRYIVFKTLQAE